MDTKSLGFEMDDIDNLKKDPFYRLTANVMDASEEESKEVLAAIESLSDEDMEIQLIVNGRG